MRRRHIPLVSLCGALAALLSACPAAHADGLTITGVTLGIAGRYRPGGWLPVAITVVNTGGDTVQGQVQLTEADTGSAVFARPVAVLGAGAAPQTFPLDVRGLDLSRGDLTASFVAGDARGDGPTLAEADSFSGTSRNAFSGLPVTDRDLLIVGFSADPAAFTALNGQAWGLMHTAGGVVVENAGRPFANGSVFPYGPPGRFFPVTQAVASVQLAAAGAADLPDKPSAYAGVDAVLLRADAPFDSLSETQTDALKAWVALGGHLIVVGGADPALFSNSFFTGLLPASVTPLAGSALTLTPKPLPGVRVLRAVSGQPTIVSGPYGAGQVTLLAFDPARSAASNPALWQMIFGAAPSLLLPVVAAQEERSVGSRFSFNPYGVQSQLSEVVMHAPALDVPGADVVGLFLFAYVLILVPINYLVLKRLDKKEWAWATVPALVVVFAAGTYAVGYAAKGSRVFINRAAILETDAGQRQAGLYAAVGLFSPRRTSYDLTVSDPNTLAAVPVPADQGYSYGRRSQIPADGYGPARVVEGIEDTQVQDASVNMWAMRAFDTQTTTDLGGTVTATTSAGPRTQSMTIMNRTPHRLNDCRLLVNGSWISVGDLGPGASSGPCTFFGSSGGTSGWANMVSPDTYSPATANDPNTDVRRRMRTALADFARGLGGLNYSQYPYYGGNFTPPAAFIPRAGEAILTGWCEDPALAGPPVRVDGHPATENTVTLVVVHIPLR